MTRLEYEHKGQEAVLNLIQLLNFFHLTGRKPMRNRGFGWVSSLQIYQAEQMTRNMWNKLQVRPEVDAANFLKRQDAAHDLIYILKHLNIESAKFGHYQDEKVHHYIHRHFEYKE